MSNPKICPYCAEEVRSEAIKCRYCGSYIGERRRRPSGEWVRSDSDRMLAGVCGGLANIVGLPTAVVRLAFVLGACFGWGIVAYAVFWIVMPLERGAAHPGALPATRDPSIERELPDDPL